MLSIIFQGFSISSNIWLSIWSNDDSAPGKESASERNLYLTVYGLLGFGQGKLYIRLSYINSYHYSYLVIIIIEVSESTESNN